MQLHDNKILGENIKFTSFMHIEKSHDYPIEIIFPYSGVLEQQSGSKSSSLDQLTEAQ